MNIKDTGLKENIQPSLGNLNMKMLVGIMMNLQKCDKIIINDKICVSSYRSYELKVYLYI